MTARSAVRKSSEHITGGASIAFTHGKNLLIDVDVVRLFLLEKLHVLGECARGCGGLCLDLLEVLRRRLDVIVARVDLLQGRLPHADQLRALGVNAAEAVGRLL